MRGVSGLLAILFCIAILIHDLNLYIDNYFSPETFTLTQFFVHFRLSALGFLWTSISPGTHQIVHNNVDPTTWALIEEILTFKALYVVIIFGFLLFAIGTLINIIRADTVAKGLRNKRKKARW